MPPFHRKGHFYLGVIHKCFREDVSESATSIRLGIEEVRTEEENESKETPNKADVTYVRLILLQSLFHIFQCHFGSSIPMTPDYCSK